MPAALTYPGVYIQEVPSGVRTITGVATSITAFVGRAAAGPTNAPTMLTSFADYERQFGGLDVASPMSYAVRDFYLNGGTQALIVRVLHDDASTATITLPGVGSPAEDLVLEASSAGDWGNRLSAAVDYDTDRALPRTSPPSTNPQRFNLTVRYRVQAGKDNFVTESFGSVSTVNGDPRFLPLVLERESAYVRVTRHNACRAPRLHGHGIGRAARRDLDRCRRRLGLRRQRDRRQRRDRRAGSEDRHLRAEPRRPLQHPLHPAAGARHHERCRRTGPPRRRRSTRPR